METAQLAEEQNDTGYISSKTCGDTHDMGEAVATDTKVCWRNVTKKSDCNETQYLLWCLSWKLRNCGEVVSFISKWKMEIRIGR